MKNLHQLLKSNKLLVGAGAHDGISAILAERTGFDLIWASGFEIATSFGIPDASILTMTEHLERTNEMDRSVKLQVIADCNNGYGDSINAVNAIKQFERAGIAGVCLEDSLFPKRCSFYSGFQRYLASPKQHALKIRACKDAQKSNEFFLIARTEALIAGNDMSDALSRAEAYAQAGADAILVHSKQKDPDEIITFSKQWRMQTPLVAIPTTYDSFSAKQLHLLGYKIVIFANQGIRSAIKAIEDNLRLLISAGQASVLREKMVSIEDVSDLVNVNSMKLTEQKYSMPGEPNL